ncbi:carbohydrate ABC transporter permease [Streptomyces griseorubiginosus]
MTMKIQPMVDNEAADPSRKAGRQRLRADRGSPRGLHRHWWPFAIPAVALTWLFFLIPFVLNIRFAFTQWTGFSDVISWNGLKNFRGLIDQGILWKSIEVTLVYAGIAMVIQNVFSLGMAVLLAADQSDQLVLPLGVLPSGSPVPVGGRLHLERHPFAYRPAQQRHWSRLRKLRLRMAGPPLRSPRQRRVHRRVEMGERPGDTLVDIAGLNAIPDSLSEAAVIDGANAWQRFWRIKFRLLAPAFTFSVVVTFIGALGAFDIVQATTQGGPGNATTVLNIAMFSQYAGDSSAPLVR